MTNRVRALLSVSNKQGLAEFAQGLVALGIELVSTGGTAKCLRDAGLTVTDVAEVTDFPEMLDGRVKTLHPTIHAGILARRDARHLAQLSAQGIAPIDLVVVNLYPFVETVARADCTFAEAVEQIDVGGPTLLRAAAKNHAHVIVVTDPADYQPTLAAMKGAGGADPVSGVDAAQRRRLAAKAFMHTAAYDGAIADYFAGQIDGETGSVEESAFPQRFALSLVRHQQMRYGENPHQRAAFYRDPSSPFGIARCQQVQGKALSYNNVADADAALECVASFEEPACVIVKHANPCGVAVGADITTAYQRAFACDSLSAFGGIIAFNRSLDQATASAILDQQFVEVVVAPDADSAARGRFADKPNVRLLLGAGEGPVAQLDFKRVNGGLLVQDKDLPGVAPLELSVVSKRQPNAAQMQDLRFAFQVVRYVHSNGIVIVRDGATIGIGAGQMSRVDSARIAVIKAADNGFDVAGAAIASDAFFPFRDSIDRSAEAGVSAIIAPGGSIRDDEVIAAADEHDMVLVFSATRHFRH